jgi:hypothetical protein
MKKHLVILFSLGLLVACNNEKKGNNNDVKNEANTKPGKSESGDNRILFTVDGEEVKTTGWNIGYFDMGTGKGKQINITSNMHDDPRTIMLNVNGDTPGTYTISTGMDAMKPGVAYGSYRPDYSKDMQNVYSFESGELVIVSIDPAAHTLNAKFHGVAKNTNGESVTITNGKIINGNLK